MKKLFLITTLCLFSSLSWGQEYEQDQEYNPKKRVAPKYPKEAMVRGIDGYCNLSFAVTPAGKVIDPEAEFCTSRYFKSSSIEAVLQFEYEPRVVDGVPQTVTGVTTRMTFYIEGGEYWKKSQEEERIREAKIKAAEEAKREKARQQELQAKKEKEEAEKQAYFDEISKYKYGTKDRPIVKEIILYSLVSEIGLRLDFGKGVRVRAVRGNLNCTDVFGDRVISEKVEDKQVRINNNKEDRYHTYKYEYRRPLDSVHNLAVFEIMDTRTLRAGGIEECSFIPTTVVVE